ncbi:type VI secretion system lipoprotein TssJ [Hyalangium sp.]|uniref:type VI secretion system lipoprotein TssJ n=1 Tax=Hyalangium sp. TaxID=2028555 RepID=UPI002D407C4D|nr:type VI secretion system lipoprotein TssJ [Hyalangium sp.]HYI03171.1 type VI secretion system lipoprotein TssJ [Hyalangium sp.]
MMTAVCALLTLPGCATSKAAACDAPPPFFARIEAADDINPDSNGRSLPTVVQFLQVKDSTKLERASFYKLSDEPKSLLGDDLLQTVEFVVAPGHEVKHWVQRDPKAQFVAAVGIFRQPLGYSWLTVARLPAVSASQCEEQPAGDRGDSPRPEDTQLRFKLQGYQIDYLRPSRRKQ